MKMRHPDGGARIFSFDRVSYLPDKDGTYEIPAGAAGAAASAGFLEAGTIPAVDEEISAAEIALAGRLAPAALPHMVTLGCPRGFTLSHGPALYVPNPDGRSITVPAELVPLFLTHGCRREAMLEEEETPDEREIQRQAAYEFLVHQRGLSDTEARATIWPEA